MSCSWRPWVLLQIFAIAWSSASDTTVKLIHWYPAISAKICCGFCDIGWGYRLYSSHCSCFQEWASRALGASPAINLPCCLVKNWSSFAGVFWYYNVMSQKFPWCRLCGTCNLQMHTDIDMQTHTGTHTHRQTTGTSIFARVVFSVPFCCCTCSDFEFCFCFQPFLRPWRWFFCARLRVFVDQRTIPGRGIPTPKTRTVVYLADVALRLYGFGPEVLGVFPPGFFFGFGTLVPPKVFFAKCWNLSGT